MIALALIHSPSSYITLVVVIGLVLHVTLPSKFNLSGKAVVNSLPLATQALVMLPLSMWVGGGGSVVWISGAIPGPL